MCWRTFRNNHGLRSASYGALLGRIFFYGKIEHFVEVFANDFKTILWLFKNPFMHYVRYQGKSLMVSKGAPLLMNKWKYFLVNFLQCHFYVWSQPVRTSSEMICWTVSQPHSPEIHPVKFLSKTLSFFFQFFYVMHSPNF